MAEWTTPQNRGTVMAFWCTCYQVGSIVASDLAGYLLHERGWRAAFFGPALGMLGVALLIFLFLKRGDQPAVSPSATQVALDAETRQVAQRTALQNPVLWAFGASYFFIKYVRYALLFWLPYYLHGTLGYAVDRAAYVSNAFEAGGVVGVIVLGILSDRVRRWSRAALSMLSLLGLALALLVCAALPQHDVWLTVGALALVGALLFGPDALLSGAAAQDVGGAAAAATATGLVNGVGSLGGMLEGLSLPAISARFGWQAMFPLLSGLAVCAALALIPAARRPDTRVALGGV
jgi:sugar phosphate permease